MKVTIIDKKKNNFSLNGTCPHCNHLASFVEATSKYTEVDKHGFVTSASVMLCQGCMRPILGILRYFIDGDMCNYVAHYPLSKPNDMVDDAIPESIRKDFKEALRCRWVDAYNATVEMCRRAIEASCIEKLGAEAAKYTDIKQMIDALADKGIITNTLKDVAHKIRLGGNRGAHSPKDDSEPPLNDDDADAVIEFTHHYFDHVYVVPARLSKYDFSKGRKATP